MSDVYDTKTYFGRNLMEGGKKLYLNAKTADVHFSFVMDDGTVKRVPAHKSILAAISDVFEAMFYGDLKEIGDVHVTDASQAVFTEFLQFFYISRIKLTMENIAGVMYLGDKYDVPNCVSVCVQYLKDVLTVDNIFIGLNLGILYNQQELLKFCENLITLNTAEAIQTTGFMECEKEVLAHILTIDVFSCSEVEVFKSCMTWVQAKSQQNILSKAIVEEHLCDLYYKIRFASMTMQQLCELLTDYKAVLSKDFETITQIIAVPNFQTDQFNTNLRQAKWNADAIIECNLNKSGEGGVKESYFCRSMETTIFSSNEPLLLGSFVCGKIQVEIRCQNCDLASDLPVEVEISEISVSNDLPAKVLLTMRTKLQSTDANHILLPYPILIRPKFRYKICIGPFPDQHGFHSGELMTQVHLSYNSTMIKIHGLNVGSWNGKLNALISCLNFNPF